MSTLDENTINTMIELYKTQRKKDYRDDMDYEDLSNSNMGAAEKAVMYADMGIGCKRRGEYDKAVLCYRKSLEILPKQGMVYYNLAKVLYLTKDYEAAQRAYYMAYVYEAKHASFDDICRHIGHAVLDPQNTGKKYANAIRGYGLSIAGISFGAMLMDRKYEYRCQTEGKNTLKKLKAQLSNFEASSVE